MVALGDSMWCFMKGVPIHGNFQMGVAKDGDRQSIPQNVSQNDAPQNLLLNSLVRSILIIRISHKGK